jgi:hypothetical protein
MAVASVFLFPGARNFPNVIHRRNPLIHRITVCRDQEKVWHASYTQVPELQFDGKRPSEALWKLLGCGYDLSIDLGTIIAVEPDSATGLNFTIEDAVPESLRQFCGVESGRLNRLPRSPLSNGR